MRAQVVSTCCNTKDNLQAAKTDGKTPATLRSARREAQKSTCVAKQLPQILLGLSAVRCESRVLQRAELACQLKA